MALIVHSLRSAGRDCQTQSSAGPLAGHCGSPWKTLASSWLISLCLIAASADATLFDGNRLLFSQIFFPPGVVIVTGERLGSVFTSGDFNNDGFTDLAVGEPFAQVDGQPAAGSVHVFFSTGTAQGFLTPVTFDPGSAAADGWFGWSLATGDFNLDGIDDLAIGVPFADRFFATDAGEVQIFFGGNGGFSGSGQVIEQPTPEGGALFGFALVAGDSAGSPGRNDTLIVGVPAKDYDPGMIGAPSGGRGTVIEGAGAVATFGASPSGLVFDGFAFQSFFGGVIEANDNFGDVLAAGDFNGDGLDDYAISSRLEAIGTTAGAGAVSFALSAAGRAGVRGALLGTFWQSLLPGQTSGQFENFGSALAAGDFNGDGWDDLAVGTPFEDLATLTEAGLVHIIPGSSSGLVLASAVAIEQGDASVASTEQGDRFGIALAAGDFDADGFTDLAAGANREDFSGAGDTGAAVVFKGSSSGVSVAGAELYVQSSAGTTNNINDHFSESLFAADFNSDGAADLAVGAPDRDSGGTDTGVFYVFFTNGLFADGFESGDTTAWTSSTP